MAVRAPRKAQKARDCPSRSLRCAGKGNAPDGHRAHGLSTSVASRKHVLYLFGAVVTTSMDAPAGSIVSNDSTRAVARKDPALKSGRK